MQWLIHAYFTILIHFSTIVKTKQKLLNMLCFSNWIYNVFTYTWNLFVDINYKLIENKITGIYISNLTWQTQETIRQYT